MNTVKSLLWAVMSILVMLSGINGVQATPITVGGPWQEFFFLDTGSSAMRCTETTCVPGPDGITEFAPAPPWTFPADRLLHLTVTDAFLGGDRFEIFDRGQSLGMTPDVPADSAFDCGNDPRICILDAIIIPTLPPTPPIIIPLIPPRISHLEFILQPGALDHSITIRATRSVLGEGAGFFQVAVPVPEPAIVLLMLGPAIWMGLSVIRRKKQRMTVEWKSEQPMKE
jgi:hypothetical protein